MITLLQLQDQVEMVWGSEHDPRLSMDDVINDAGRYLMGMHSWNWRNRPPVSLSAVSSQPYLSVPDDFGSNGEVIELVAADSALYKAVPSDIGLIEMWRTSTLYTPLYTYHWALSYPSQVSSTYGAGNPRIELYPTPSNSDNVAFYLTYRAGWKTLVDATDAANIPPHMNHLFGKLVQAFAADAYDPGIAPFKIDTLDEIEQSAMLARLKSSDGGAQAIVGPMRGGILDRGPTGRGFGIVTDTTNTWV